jgi:hypothetical protein
MFRSLCVLAAGHCPAGRSDPDALTTLSNAVRRCSRTICLDAQSAIVSVGISHCLATPALSKLFTYSMAIWRAAGAFPLRCDAVRAICDDLLHSDHGGACRDFWAFLPLCFGDHSPTQKALLALFLRAGKALRSRDCAGFHAD